MGGAVTVHAADTACRNCLHVYRMQCTVYNEASWPHASKTVPCSMLSYVAEVMQHMQLDPCSRLTE